MLTQEDGEQSSPAPAKTTPAAAAPKKAETAAPRTVPGAAGANKDAGRGGNRGGRYPARGGARNVYRGSEEKGDAPVAEDAAAGFEGERVGECGLPSRVSISVSHNHFVWHTLTP